MKNSNEIAQLDGNLLFKGAQIFANDQVYIYHVVVRLDPQGLLACPHVGRRVGRFIHDDWVSHSAIVTIAILQIHNKI